ncbi:FAD-binding oxidoreductase [Ponticoccus sp. SC2-23]|uniref:FAD-binding oxidoreductase n=1 Tax=Alexandriicola marinus TaxID=2081710 RepID=UPI000FD9FEB0|nr:FAD-binding oxidoreductase [Alexandriicola marinus]MBM1221576.1 FAD-binding oxidoreductase [Ponticoccus sp. SC6-9]MBM1226617.1 FAD-binding oxidoreductase [Ponticoccus sp. SC6-15]MBM1230568.1 FAD-binding oxidoreductase [Ponticoccus sp. SC6-38]MBM1235091.1 FAD-binding oxidoreductase [Ponticoccus sp. SC6-45]MBM1239589.1 FAD-binding oxidoreductase [Ponticoccus sp. SC6-49]MBM1243371.1 FAD-binding oxidoreductase [Ponticoccus sp. SC2-64]MBM1248615.1 FAD-binding oxidoreductase [Ponticoccus sp. SC
MLNPATEETLAALRATCPDLVIREESAAYLEEPRGRWAGKGIVLAPGTTAEVAQIMTYAHANRIGVVPYGGGTGLVGGQIMTDGPAPLILSLERMNRVREVHADENVLVADGGTILADIQKAAEGAGRLFPLSLASEGSARIGGLLATNAGGVNVLRYGNARAQCLGLEVVTAEGEVWSGLSRLRKDNTGYDLRDLFIGSEGTLGIITAASLRMMPRPREMGAAVFAVASPEAAIRLLSLAQERLGETVSAFELMGRQGPDFLNEVGPETRMPLDPMPDWTVLIDVGLSGEGRAEEALAALFEAALEAGLVTNGVLASSEAQRAEFWALRENIPAANRRIGAVSSHDISVPVGAIPEFIAKGAPAIAAIGQFRINCFGHVGDGNLHYNVFPVPGKTRADHEGDRDAIKRAVHDLTHSLGGSVSAEHGIGRLKTGDLRRYGDPVKLALMRRIKTALDPHGILNPGAVLD